MFSFYKKSLNLFQIILNLILNLNIIWNMCFVKKLWILLEHIYKKLHDKNTTSWTMSLYDFF